MLSEEVLEKLSERLINRIEEANAYILEKIGDNIKKISTLSPSEARQLSQILKYGGDYEKIVNKLAEVTELNKKDIYKIFEEVAKKNQEFAKQFYNYRNKKFIPYEQNKALQRQVKVFADITANEYLNLSKTRAIGYMINDLDGNLIFSNISDLYKETIDRAVISISQGKSTFENEMYKMMKNIGKSGLKTVEYESGYTRRLDSAVRMNLLDTLRDMSNKVQQDFGKEFDSDGVEISVHEMPAPDHAEVQGRQFSNEEFDNFQNDRRAKSYTGKIFEPEVDGKDRRSISEYNCRHYIFSIILGISEPIYSDKQLNEILTENKKGFNMNGRHYTLYEGTQLQRQLETKIREQKDIQILAKASDNKDLILESQSNITVLTNKYRELSKISGLKTKMERLRVSGYKRIAVKK